MSIYVRDADGNRQKIAGVGLPGPAGKSAYQYAVEGGFSGTEEEFRAVVGVRSNPNLLDNWYLADPINQRGQTEYTENEQYTIDQWYLRGTISSQLTVSSNGLTLVRQEGRSEALIAQVFEDYVFQALVGKQVTLSFLTSGNELGFVTLIVDPESTMETIRAKTTNCIAILYRWSGSHERHLQVLIGCSWSAGESADVRDTIVAVKLELGPVQTLAHKDAFGTWVLNDPPPNKALELAKCQRYQLPLLDRSGNYGCPIGFGVFQNTLGRIIIPTPTTMRGTPTLTVLNGNISAFEIIDVSGTPHPVATITTQGKFSNGIYLGVTITDTIATSPSICALKYTSTGIPMLDSNL